MAGGGKGRTLEETPTWAVAVVCFVLVVISIIIEQIIHRIGSWLNKTHRRALFEALEKIKSELMLLGFISLLLTVFKDPISKICVSKKIGSTWHPCGKKQEEAKYKEKEISSSDKCAAKNKVPLVSSDGIHQLHIFIFVLAVFHILYCVTTMALGRAKMRRWMSWEKETKTMEYQFINDPERFRFARETTFGRRHLNFWTKTPVLLWIVCFFRQFIRSVPKVDYLTLRHGFIMAHLAPQSHTRFDFQKYIKRSLEEDFKVVVGISPWIWFCAVLFLLFNTHGWYSYLWLPFIPLIIILLVGTKLQVVITKMGLRIQERGEVVKGVPVVQPGDDLFWFNRPRLLIYLINFVLFQNAFQLAFFAWAWFEFGLRSCFHEHNADISIRVTMGILIQFLCSYVTLPLYALVTQMGTTMKPTIFNERVAKALRHWHQTARKQIKQNRSGSVTPVSSLPTTPTHRLSPVHLLRYYKSELDSYQSSPRRTGVDNEYWPDGYGSSPSPSHHQGDGSSSHHHGHQGQGAEQMKPQEPSLIRSPSGPSGAQNVHEQREIDMGSDFSFDKTSRV